MMISSLPWKHKTSYISDESVLGLLAKLSSDHLAPQIDWWCFLGVLVNSDVNTLNIFVLQSDLQCSNVETITENNYVYHYEWPIYVQK